MIRTHSVFFSNQKRIITFSNPKQLLKERNRTFYSEEYSRRPEEHDDFLFQVYKFLSDFKKRRASNEQGIWISEKLMSLISIVANGFPREIAILLSEGRISGAFPSYRPTPISEYALSKRVINFYEREGHISPEEASEYLSSIKP